MSASKQPQKKDKGKVIQTAADYQLQILTQSQFTPLSANFPPLPYKAAVTNPSPSNPADAYVIRHTEHLLLTSCKPPPPTNIIPSIVQKTFGSNHHFATDDLRKTQKFYELILVDTNSVSLTHTFDKYHPTQVLYSKYIIKSIINAQQWKEPFQERKFSITYSP